MRKYIFLTSEGSTFQPASDEDALEVDDLQVIGFAEGNNADEAYESLLADNPAVKETTFKKIFCYELDNEYELSRKGYNLEMRR